MVHAWTKLSDRLHPKPASRRPRYTISARLSWSAALACIRSDTPLPWPSSHAHSAEHFTDYCIRYRQRPSAGLTQPAPRCPRSSCSARRGSRLCFRCSRCTARVACIRVDVYAAGHRRLCALSARFAALSSFMFTRTAGQATTFATVAGCVSARGFLTYA